VSVSTVDLSPRKLVLIMVATLLVLTAGTWFALVAPKRTSATHLQTNIQDAQAQLTAKRKAAQEKAARDARLQELRLERALPNVLAMPQVVVQLSRIATEEHVSLDSITPQPAVAYSGFESVPLTVVLTGQFDNIEGFLHELRIQVRVAGSRVNATGRLFDVQSVLLQQATPPPRVTATLTLDAFYYSGLAVAPVGASSATTTSS
jgi:Tfp pilus assembly protein PilO